MSCICTFSLKLHFTAVQTSMVTLKEVPLWRVFLVPTVFCFFLIPVVFKIKTVIAYQSEAADFPFFP